jgi:hypothetical protein
MKRRSFLAFSAGGLAATAGCLGGEGNPENGDGNAGDDPTDTQTPTDAPTETDTPTPTPKPTTVERVSMAGLQPARIELGTPDSIGVFGETEGQSLYVSVDIGDENPPKLLDFEFELDNHSVKPVTETRNLWRRSEEQFGPEYTPEEGGWLLFDLPATAENPDSARLTWPGGSWRPPADIRSRLASPNPTFEVTVTAGETIPIGEQPDVTVTFENTSSVPGTFVMAVNRVGPYVAYAPEATVRRLLQPGERATATITPSFFDTEEIEVGDTTELKFDWVGGETSRELEFVAPDSA